MTAEQREALVERMAEAIVAVGYNPATAADIARAALAVAEPVVRADEREVCAKVCDARYMGDNNREDQEARRCAAAIRTLPLPEPPATEETP